MKKKGYRLCTIDAPCKINLHLKIGEKRQDGFHNIESLFAALALSDTLRFEVSGEEGGCAVSVNQNAASPEPRAEIPLEKNSVFRAVSLFRENTGFTGGLKITLDKRIPLGAGLGGGSSDAASALLALNLLSGAILPGAELEKMAAVLGSDVPFFLKCGAAFVTGRGEMVEPVKAPRNLFVLLVKPPFPSDTSAAYRLLDAAREKGAFRGIPEINNTAPLNGISHPPIQMTKKDLISALGKKSGFWPFFNDFLPVFLDERDSPDGGISRTAAAYKSILADFNSLGALYSGLSGSGSCCFGIFDNGNSAKIAEKALSGQGNYICLTFFLARRADAVLE